MTTVLLGTLLIVAYVWWQSYQPLSTGNYFSPGADVIRWRPGKPYHIGFSIRNDGRVDMRVVGVSGIQTPGLLLGPSHTLLGTSPSAPTDLVNPPYIPFRPFTLKPGHQRMIVFEGRFLPKCDMTGDGASGGSAYRAFDHFDHRIHVLGHTRTATLRRVGGRPDGEVHIEAKRC